MDLKEALNEYSFENVAQFRTIAKQLGYSEEYNRGNLLFTKGNEKYKTSIDEIRSHIKKPELIDSLQNQSKERVSKVLERNKINDPKYIKELSEKYNIDIVKTNDKYNGLIVIDNENKVSYRGKSLFDYAFMNGYMLDGRDKLEKNVMSELRDINGRQAKLRHDDNGIAVFYKKEALLIPDSIFGKKLTAEQKDQLKNGETILFKGKNDIFLQLDKELNAVVVRTNKELPVPKIVGKTDFFKGYELTPMDRYLLANGKSIDNKLMAGKDGYFIADFSMSPDKKGVIFSNIQNVSKDMAEQMISSQKEPLKNSQDMDKTGQEHNLIVDVKVVNQEQSNNTHLKEGKELEFKDAIEKNDFIKITSLKNEGYKPSENLLKDMQQSGSITKEQFIAVEKIFDLKPENSKTIADVKLAEKTPSKGNGQNLTDGVAKTINNMFNDL
jgi:hypothetical protein